MRCSRRLPAPTSFIVLDYSLIAAADRAASAAAAPGRGAHRCAAGQAPGGACGCGCCSSPTLANERYGAQHSPQLRLLRAAGVEVVLARLDKLRDPNFLYSSLWRLGLRWWDRPRGPLGFETRRLNFKGDHRQGDHCR